MKQGLVGMVALLGLFACSSPKGSGFGDAPKTDQNATQPGGGADGGAGPSFGAEVDAGANGCGNRDNVDHDGDGWSFADGDCNDCDPNSNPGAFDVPGNGQDEDCDGTPDNDGVACDGSLPLAPTDALDGARAIGLCRTADPNGVGPTKTWGVLSARWVKSDGTSETVSVSHGVMATFGVNMPQEGSTFLGLSSGAARAPSMTGYKNPSGYDKGYTCGTPTGYPKESPACPGVHTGSAHDGAGLELKIRVPTNAKSFSYQENFFTYEFPGFICSTYNDFFVAMLTPKPPALPDGNIAFDQSSNPISVNNSLLQVCAAQTAGGKTFSCPLGVSSLSGTGFESHAATGWLQTQAPVNPGDTITLLFAIWDSGDGVLDSTVLLDKFQWLADPANGTTTVPAPPK